MKKDSFVKGTLVSYISIIIVKVLGVLYVIPFYSIIGEAGGVLYSYAYNIYTLFLNVSTSGIPIALSIIVSEYLVLKKYKTKEIVFKCANKMVFFLSLFFFLILFCFSDFFAQFFVKDLLNGSSVSDVSLTFKTISLCLLIIPFLSTIKGYLQAHRFVSITSISEVIEQVVRIGIILIGSYITIKVLDLNVGVGVSSALLGASIGGLIAYIYLRLKIKKNKKEFDLVNEDEAVESVNSKKIIKKVLSYSLPVILVSITNNIYNIVDMKLILKGLSLIGYDAKTTELIASIVCTWAPKICIIIGAAAIGMGTSIIPHLVSSFTKKDMEEVNAKYVNAIKMVLFLTLPLALIIIILSSPIYYIFYGKNIFGSPILKLVALTNILSSIFLVSTMSLQSMRKYKIVYFSTIIGLVVNLLLDIPMILILDKLYLSPYLGTIISTLISYTISIIIVFTSLKKEYSFKYKGILLFIKKMILPLLILGLSLVLFNNLIPITKDNRLTALIKCGIISIIPIILYIICLYKCGAIHEVFASETIKKFTNKFKRKEKKNE